MVYWVFSRVFGSTGRVRVVREGWRSLCGGEKGRRDLVGRGVIILVGEF